MQMSISAERNFSKEKTKLDLDSSKGRKNLGKKGSQPRTEDTKERGVREN